MTPVIRPPGRKVKKTINSNTSMRPPTFLGILLYITQNTLKIRYLSSLQTQHNTDNQPKSLKRGIYSLWNITWPLFFS